MLSLPRRPTGEQGAPESRRALEPTVAPAAVPARLLSGAEHRVMCVWCVGVFGRPCPRDALLAPVSPERHLWGHTRVCVQDIAQVPYGLRLSWQRVSQLFFNCTVEYSGLLQEPVRVMK